MPWVEVPWSEMTEEERREASKGRTYRKGRKARYKARTMSIVRFVLRLDETVKTAKGAFRADIPSPSMNTLPDGSPIPEGMHVTKDPNR